MIQPRMIQPRWLLLAFVATFHTSITMPAAADASGLAAALRATLDHHPAIAGKRAEIKAKAYTGDSVRAQRLPSISAQANTWDRGRDEPTQEQNGTGTLRARQPLWTFGRLPSAIAYADEDVQLSKAQLLQIKRELLDQTAVAYCRVVGAKQRLDVARSNADSLATLVQQIERRFEGKLASNADVRLANARKMQTDLQVENFTSTVDTSLTELYALTQTPVEVDANVAPDTVHLPELAQLQSQALAQSANAQVKQHQIDLAKANLRREKNATSPTLSLQADRYIDHPYIDKDPLVSVVIESSFDGLGFVSRGRNRAAAAGIDAADEDLAATRVELTRTVRTLYANRELQGRLLRTQTESVNELSAILASYQRQYEAGQKSWLDVLNMQRELSEQRLQKAQVENDWLIYTLKLAAIHGDLDALAGATSGSDDDAP